jgi:hypothetical protein
MPSYLPGYDVWNAARAWSLLGRSLEVNVKIRLFHKRSANRFERKPKLWHQIATCTINWYVQEENSMSSLLILVYL